MNNVKHLQQENFQITREKQLLQEMFDNIQSEKEKHDTKENELWTNISEKESQINQFQVEIDLLNKQLKKSDELSEGLIRQVTDLQLKIHTVEQNAHTSYLNKSKDFNDTHFKYGLGYENPYHLKKGIPSLPFVYDYDIFLLTKDFPQYGLTPELKEEKYSEMEWMKLHDTKYSKLHFCYDNENLSSLSHKKEDYLSANFFQNYPNIESESNEKEVKTYVPILVLEDKILNLEKELSRLKSENTKLTERLESQVQYEYDSDTESEFEGGFKIREEEILPVVDSNGYLKFKEISSLKPGDKLKFFYFDKTGMFNQFFLDDELPEQLSSESTLVSSKPDISSCDSNDANFSNIKANDFASTSVTKQVKLVVERKNKSILSCSSVAQSNLSNQVDLITIRKAHEIEKKKLKNTIKQLKAEKSRINCDSIFWNSKCRTLTRNYDLMVEQLSIYEEGHCYAGKNVKVIPAKVTDKTKFTDTVKKVFFQLQQDLKN